MYDNDLMTWITSSVDENSKLRTCTTELVIQRTIFCHIVVKVRISASEKDWSVKLEEYRW